MKGISAKGFTFSVSIYAVLHFVTYFYYNDLLFDVLSVFGFVTLVFGLLLLPASKLQLPIFLSTIAVAVLLFSGAPLIGGLAEGFLQMRSLISLLLIVPMISWVLNEEPYIDEIMSYGHKFLNESRKFYLGLAGMTQIIAHFLLFGAVPMMYSFIDSFLKEHKNEAWERFKGTAILRGFALSTLWVISIPSFIFAVEALGATLWKSVVLGFAAAIGGSLLGAFFAYRQEKKDGEDFSAVLQTEIAKAMKKSRNTGRWNRDVAEFAFLFISLFGAIFFIHEMWNIDFLVVIPLVILFWTALYFLLKKRMGNYLTNGKKFVANGISRQAQQLSILLSAGLMIYALNHSGTGKYVIDGMNAITEIVSFLNILLLLPFILIFLGFIGLGPLPVIVLVTGILESAILPYPPELIVLAVTSGSVISILLSPFVMPVIILSSMNGLSGIRNGIHFNLKYAIAFYIMIQLFIQTSILL
ncbi:hypothetical protein [Planococcus sp. CAU13]|uniref:hypothetical protein n=1 Tax=Planococcus sp. CAU13 TaxID=1541197 RepID=UPI00052FEC28|nr:hypothetical protein [Planococcus sp. CAU13]